LELGGGALVDRSGPDRGRPVGLDLSERQLGHANRLIAEAGVDMPVLQASTA
jgi:hypothetical protein